MIVTIGASVEAYGHPDDCEEPAEGSVVKEADSSLTVTNSNNETKQVASVNTADIDIPSHAHSYSDMLGCYNNSSHTLDPDERYTSLSYNGSPLYITGDNVATDPQSGGRIAITNTGINNSLGGSNE